MLQLCSRVFHYLENVLVHSCKSETATTAIHPLLLHNIADYSMFPLNNSATTFVLNLVLIPRHPYTAMLCVISNTLERWDHVFLPFPTERCGVHDELPLSPY